MDRVLITFALIVLLLSLGGIFGFDFIFSNEDRYTAEGQAIAEIASGMGDVRVKYNDEVRWQKSRGKQKLLTNDAVFAGEDSHVDLVVGQSQLSLESNTLIVLRQESVFNSLNINYGSLTGTIAKNEKLIVETSDGEKFEMNASAATKIAIKRRAGKTEVKVIEGNAKITKDGKVQNLSSRDSIFFTDKFKSNPIKFYEPSQYVRYSHDANEPIRFAWNYQFAREIGAVDQFTLEFSTDPSFQQLVMREELVGVREFSTAMAFPQELYYRVKDQAGSYSETHRLQLLQPHVPIIRFPEDGATLNAEAGQSLPQNLELAPLQPESKVTVQVAGDMDFTRIVDSRTLLEPKALLHLPTGEYFLRAKAEFRQLNLHGTNLQTDWSKSKRITVREKLDPLSLEQIRLPSLVVIPNRKYPRALYSARASSVQRHLIGMPVFTGFFAPMMIKGYELVVHRGRTDELPSRLTQPDFPENWIVPGNLNIRYQLQTRGVGEVPVKTHTMRIEMEAPNRLRSNERGKLGWSPILFAQGYEGEISGAGKVSRFKTTEAAFLARVKPGTAHAFRVRALNKKAQAISPWSESHAFEIAKPPPEPVIQLTESEPPLEREPAQVAASTAKVEEEKLSAWQKIGYWLWFGSGMNFFDVRQTVSNQADVSYQNIKGPSFFAEAGYMAKSRLGAILGYKRTPGRVSIDNYPVSNPNFVWDTISLEAIYGLPFVGHFLKQTLNWGLRAGFQNHSFPFLYIETGRTVNNSQSEMLAGSLGFFMETTGRWKQHWHMRYQQPLRSSTDGGNSFDIKPKYAFDGSIGTSYLLTERLKTGLFWYGQMHTYDFTYTSPTQTNIGSQSLFYSNMELRLGLDF